MSFTHFYLDSWVVPLHGRLRGKVARVDKVVTAIRHTARCGNYRVILKFGPEGPFKKYAETDLRAARVEEIPLNPSW